MRALPPRPRPDPQPPAAKETGDVAAAREELGDFVAAMRSVPELRDTLVNPKLATAIAIAPTASDEPKNLRMRTSLFCKRSNQVQTNLLRLATRERERNSDPTRISCDQGGAARAACCIPRPIDKR